MAQGIGRRTFLGLSTTGLLWACAPTHATRLRPTPPPQLAPAAGFPPVAWSVSAAQERLLQARSDLALVPRDEAILRRRCRPVPVGLELAQLARRMEQVMRRARGVGLAAPQVGLPLRVALLMLDYKRRNPRLLLVRNPVIVERSDETIEGYEGCLSLPGVGGLVRRNRWIRVLHLSREGQVLSTTAEGHNAVLWQHELDHLEGVLFTDRLIGPLLPMEEVRRRRERQRGPTSSPTTGLQEQGPLRL